MDTLTKWDGHGKSIFYPLLGTYTDAMSHRHAGTEIGVGESFWCKALHQGAHDRVATWVPSGSNNADGARLAVDLHESLTVAAYVGVNIERVDGVDAERENLLGIFLARAGRSGEDGHVDVFQFTNILYHLVWCQFCGLVFCAMTTHDSGNFEVGRGLKSLDSVLSDVAVSDDGCSDFFHVYLV